MESIEILGYAAAAVIGIVLGLIGGGGSILTVPVFVYMLDIAPVTATAYSLFVVGAAALVGTVKSALGGMVDFRTGLVFAAPALLAVYATRKYLVPAIPEQLFEVGGVPVSRDMGIMVFFAIVMLLAAISMIRKGKPKAETEAPVQYNYPLIVVEGLVVGLLTGIVGAGGGFLIIPALVLLARLPMKKAVATSLMVIAIKSLIGFVGDVQNVPIDWPFLLAFSFCAILGIFAGLYLSKFVEGGKLKKAFGWFVLAMGLYIVLKEFWDM